MTWFTAVAGEPTWVTRMSAAEKLQRRAVA
jgi:hypothetical protein